MLFLVATISTMDARYHKAMRNGLFVVVMLVVMTQSTTHVEAVTDPGDIEALKEVKLALNASSIMPSACIASWNFTLDPCDTYTPCIDCTRSSLTNISRVIGLRLERGAGYQGFLSPSIGNLTSLQRLVITGNAFYGPIPSTLGNCIQLFQLDLSMNFFTGPLPSSLGNLLSLSFLSVAYNALSGPIPVSFNNLKNLTYLYLDENRLSGTIPSLTGMSSLTLFDASSNNFTGTLPHVPESLSLLALRKNQLMGHLPPSLKNLTLLQVLDLRENNLFGTIGSFLYTLPSLQQVNLSYNSFSAMEPHNGAPSEVLSMDLSNNAIEGTLPESLARMEKLTVLTLRSNMFTGPIPYVYALKAANNLNGSLQLGQLYLDDNYLSGEIPSPLLNVSADVVSANLVSNCLDSCPPSLFFCSGGMQKSPVQCHEPVVLPGSS